MTTNLLQVLGARPELQRYETMKSSSGRLADVG